MARKPLSYDERCKREILPYKIWFRATLLLTTGVFVYALTLPVRGASVGFVCTGVLALLSFHAYNMLLSKETDTYYRDWTRKFDRFMVRLRRRLKKK
jgi:hypothetical protein